MQEIGRRSLLTAGAVASLGAFSRRGRAGQQSFRLAHNNATQSAAHASALAFAQSVAERSGGTMRIEVFPNAVLGSEEQTLRAVSEGTLDMALAPVGVAAAYSNIGGLIEMPYLFRDAAHARAALDGAYGRACAEEMRKRNVVLLGWPEVGIRQITANKPIRTARDLAGLKIRVAVSQPILATFRALGAAAETLPFVQLPEALRTGRFEAEENPINIIVDYKMNAVQSHVSLTRHAYTAFMLVVSSDVFDDLPAAGRDALTASGPVGADVSRKWADRVEADGLATLKAAGMTVVADVDAASFQVAVAAATEQLAKTFGADTLKQVRALAG